MDGFAYLSDGIGDLTRLIQAVIGLMAVAWVVVEYHHDKSILKLMTSLLLAAVFVWGAHNADWLLTRARAEVTGLSGPDGQAPHGGDEGNVGDGSPSSGGDEGSF